eukprot:282233_1
MFNLSIIVYVIHWIILICLCRKPLYILLLFTAGICFATIGFNATNENYEHSFGGWNWFGYVKAVSLVIGYIAYCCLYVTRDSKNLNKIARIFLQWILAINVFEAGIYACQYYEFIIGILLIIISPFSPGFYINDEKTLYSKKSNIIQQEKLNFVSVKWYFRLYLIVLCVFHATGYDFSVYNINVYASLTCLFSFLLNEYYLNNYANHFNIRVFALFIGTFIDAAYDLKWFNKQPNMVIHVNAIVRNVIQAAVLAFLFGLCLVNDKLRSKSEADKTEQYVVDVIDSNCEIDMGTQKDVNDH